MANIYVRSTDGNDADNGSTWALAKATLTGAAAIDAAGDTIYVSQSHSETTASLVTIALAGTIGSPVNVLCVNDSGDPPTSLSTAGVVTTTGASNIAITGIGYVNGLQFNCGTGTGAPAIKLGYSTASLQQYDDCVFRIVATGSGYIYPSSSGESKVTLNNPVAKFAGVSQGYCLAFGNVKILGGSFESGTTTPTNIFVFASGSVSGSTLTVDGMDFSNLGTTFNLFAGGGINGNHTAVIRNSKLPSGWSGSLISSAFTEPGVSVAMHNCDSGDTNYRMWTATFAGTARSETTIVRSGGASDGTTPISWKLETTSNAKYPMGILESPEIVIWNETTGSNKTVTIEIVHDSQGAGNSSDFTNEEIWMEVQYLGTSGYPLGSFVSNVKADVLATAADHPNSSVTWTTTGLTTPVKQYLQVTFTPQEKGFIHAIVYLAKASKTVYIDPLLTVA